MKFRRFLIRKITDNQIVYYGIQFGNRVCFSTPSEGSTINTNIENLFIGFANEQFNTYFQYVDDKDFSVADIPGMVDGYLGSMG